jgi:hypothetical protein
MHPVTTSGYKPLVLPSRNCTSRFFDALITARKLFVSVRVRSKRFVKTTHWKMDEPLFDPVFPQYKLRTIRADIHPSSGVAAAVARSHCAPGASIHPSKLD